MEDWGINGYVQSMLWSPGMALIANWWPGSKRGFATGFANAFSGLGSVVTAFVVSGSLVVIAAALLFLAGFFIYGINSLVWAFATDIGGRTFGGTATGVLDCAAYIGASVQALFFGSVLTKSGDWKFVFLCIVGVLGVMVVAAVMAGVEKKRD